MTPKGLGQIVVRPQIQPLYLIVLCALWRWPSPPGCGAGAAEARIRRSAPCRPRRAASHPAPPAPVAFLRLEGLPEGGTVGKPQASKPVERRAYTLISRILASSSTHQIMLSLLVHTGDGENHPLGDVHRMVPDALKNIWQSSAGPPPAPPHRGLWSCGGSAYASPLSNQPSTISSSAMTFSANIVSPCFT